MDEIPFSQIKLLKIKQNIAELHEPIIIEFSGTPNSGKTTTITAISKYFRHNGISVSLIPENSNLCPLREKLDLNFNIWTGLQNILMLLETIEKKADFIFIDRGIFDTIVWMKLLLKKKKITLDEYKVIKNFFLLHRWVKQIGLVIVVTLNSTKALEREYSSLLTNAPGTIMNENILQLYNNCLSESVKEFGKVFNIYQFDTSNQTTKESVIEIFNSVLKSIDKLVEEPIATISPKYLLDNINGEKIVTDKKLIRNICAQLSENISFVERSSAEDSKDKVQIVSAIVFKHKDYIVTSIPHGIEHGDLLQNKSCIWIGGHVRASDQSSTSTRPRIFTNTLIRETKEEIDFSFTSNQIPMYPNAIIWDTTNPKSIKHLALFFEYEISDEQSLPGFDKREYWETPKKSTFLQVNKLDYTLNEIRNWESWSSLYLEKIYNIKLISDSVQQLSLIQMP